MQLTIPKDRRRSQLRITVRSVGWTYETTIDNSFHTIEVALPHGLSEGDVEAFAEFLDNAGRTDNIIGPVVLKTRKRARRPKPGT